jgi:hypothetical protein
MKNTSVNTITLFAAAVPDSSEQGSDHERDPDSESPQEHTLNQQNLTLFHFLFILPDALPIREHVHRRAHIMMLQVVRLVPPGV